MRVTAIFALLALLNAVNGFLAPSFPQSASRYVLIRYRLVGQSLRARLVSPS